MLKQPSPPVYVPYFFLRVALFVVLVFSLILFLVREQPYDERQNRQPFIQDGCTAACFAGIQPGITTVEEAVTRLEASGWTRGVDNRTVNNVSGFISWDWSDQKPAWISGNIQGKIWATQKRVVTIVVYGALQLGNTRLSLGSPDQEVIDRSADRQGVFSLYSASYGQAGLVIQSWQPCRVLEPLRRPVILTYTLSADPKTFPARDSLMDLYHTCAFAR
jgi:hypothetical protein